MAEYDALILAGRLDGEPVQLIEGVLVETPPISPEHSSTVGRVATALRRQLPPGWDVRDQQPLRVPPHSEPEPDVSVVRDEDYDHRHPDTALLVVEVAWSSLELDLEAKPGVYAGAGVTEYWVVDIERRVVHVHRRPVDGAYDEVVVHRAGPLVSATEPSFTLDPESVLPRA